MKGADLFAGAGGFSEGATQAGVDIVYAANHWEIAVKTHAENHPGTLHECQDLRQANFYLLPDIDLLIASPACQGHTHARGKERPHHDETRSTAWAVVDCLEAKRPPVALVENVPEFLDWTLFPAWRLALEALGYTLAPHVLDAADFGVPQHRRRVFIVATRTKKPFEIRVPKREPVGADSFIDWRFAKWSPIRKPGRSPATIARAEAGRAAFGDRFVMPYYGSGSGKTGRDISRPIGTITTRDRWAIVDGDRMRMLNVDEYRAAMSFRPDYRLPATRATAIHLLGNAVPPYMARDVIRQIRARA